MLATRRRKLVLAIVIGGLMAVVANRLGRPVDHAQRHRAAPARSSDPECVDRRDQASHQPRAIEAPRIDRDEIVDSTEVQGQLVVVDDEGHEHARGSGTMLVNGIAVAIEDGRWSTVVLSVVDGLGLSNIEVDERRVVPDQTLVPIPESGPVVLRGRFVRPSMLRVLGCGSKADLDGVEVVTTSQVECFYDAHPAGIRDLIWIARDARSPVQLPDEDGAVVYWVHAPHHAWGRIHFDHSIGGERAIRLRPAGNLIVNIASKGVDPDIVLRLRRANPDSDDPLTTCSPQLHGPVEIADLPVGDYDLSAEIGKSFMDPLVLSSVRVHVSRGETRYETLTIVNPGEPPGSPLAGTIWLSPRWGEGLPELTVTPKPCTTVHEHAERKLLRLRPPKVRVRPTAKGRWEWDAGALPTGEYILSVKPSNYSLLVVLGRTGSRAVRVLVPDPVETAVHFVDDVSGSPAHVTFLTWSHIDPRDLPHDPTGGVAHASEPNEPGTIYFLAPSGVIWMQYGGPAYSSAEAIRIQLEPSATEHVVAVRPSCGFDVFLFDGTTPVPAEELDFQVRAPGGEACDYGLHFMGRGVRAYVSSPGNYRIACDSIDGFLPIEPREVIVEEGRFTPLTVPLEREN